MTIKQLHYFIAVAEAKSFTHAARNCFIAQTAMSQQISSMERRSWAFGCFTGPIVPWN